MAAATPPHFSPRRMLGRTGFVATLLGIGDVADRSVPLEECVATVRRGLAAGLNLVDTAPGYEQGYSEQIVGRALEGRRDGVFVIDKIDHHDQPVLPQVEESLGRLGLEATDLFVLHGLSTVDGWQGASAPGGSMEQLAECVAKGLTRFRGISSHHPDVLELAIESGLCDVVLFPLGPFCDEHYVRRILPLARARGVGTVCFKTFGAGKLLGDTAGYGQPLKERPRGKLSSGGVAAPAAEAAPGAGAPTLPRLSVEQCVGYTLTLDPDVALLGMSFPNEQDAAFAAARAFAPLAPERMRQIREEAERAIAGQGRLLVEPAAESHVISLIRAQLRSTVGVLSGFQGNARALLITEPLWGVPYNLYATYASVYMLALGCTETQVGLVATVSLLFQIVFSLLGGWLTDRLGRKRATIICDLISWSIPTLLLAFAGTLAIFVIAAIINAVVRVVYTSWDCLMVEDTPVEQRVHFYTWIAIAGILAGFISPVAGLLVDRFGLVPAERALYLFAFASMTFMFFWRNTLLRETPIGLRKMRETRHGDASATLKEYGRIVRQLAASPLTVAAFILSLLLNIQFTLRGTFLSILLVRGLGFSDAIIALFPAVNAAVTLAIYALGMPAIGRMPVHRPFIAGLVLSAISTLLLVVSPMRSMPYVVASTVIGALGAAVTGPLSSALVANSVPANDRAKTMSLFFGLVLAACSPFGYIGGLLAARSERLPFALMAVTFLPAIVLAALLPAIQRRQALRGDPGA